MHKRCVPALIKMKLTTDEKIKIQCFVYFLFKGTVDPRLIKADYNYLDKLLAHPKFLYNCFEIFAFAAQDNKEKAEQIVGDYILDIHKDSDRPSEILDAAVKFNSQQTNYWRDFLTLAKWFCFNSFPRPLSNSYLSDLDGNGSDAVPAFAVWTNSLEVDNLKRSTNSEQALNRANQRLKLWDNETPSTKFEEWELEQEIY